MTANTDLITVKIDGVPYKLWNLLTFNHDKRTVYKVDQDYIETLKADLSIPAKAVAASEALYFLNAFIRATVDGQPNDLMTIADVSKEFELECYNSRKQCQKDLLNNNFQEFNEQVLAAEVPTASSIADRHEEHKHYKKLTRKKKYEKI